MNITVRLSEGGQTEAQIRQRDRCYEAAEILRNSGFKCDVVEFFVSNPGDNSAAIFLGLEASS